MKKVIQLLILLLLVFASGIYGQGIIIDHNSAKLDPIPIWALELASDSLHIAYGHTSHGSQLITGMTELENQSTDLVGYKGDYYCWNHYQYPGEDGPCIEIHDQFRPGDLGHLGDTQWADYTRDYLDNDTVSENINVIIWSWCGGCSDNTVEGISTYLETMNQLELDYPEIRFVYMTGHLDIWNRDTLLRNNQLIRDYCIENDKILYDFADIESYNPDGVYYEYANDNCNYYNKDLVKLGNWATEWQNAHVESVDWFYCVAAHSEALNGNLKAYAAWWLWCRLVGWEGVVGLDAPSVEKTVTVFSRHKTIVIQAPDQSHATAAVFNLMGEQILSATLSGGQNFISTNLASGIYFVRVRFRDGEITTGKVYIP